MTDRQRDILNFMTAAIFLYIGLSSLCFGGNILLTILTFATAATTLATIELRRGKK
jgi:hypothetical protein